MELPTIADPLSAVSLCRADGFETIMMNSNPETVSTDYDTSSRLYFEPLTIEDVLNVIEKERPEGIIIQFGGQTPSSLPIPFRPSWKRTLCLLPAVSRRSYLHTTYHILCRHDADIQSLLCSCAAPAV